ncbi:MAG: TIGR04219 family outer membrane beta-barrel protein [Campylobacterales bacterium]
MKKSFAGFALAGALALSAQADLLGFGAGAGLWSATPSGSADYGQSFDIKSDTGLSSSNNGYLWAYLEHPVLFLPNIRIERTGFESDGTKATNITFGGETFNVGDTKTELTLNQIDTILYYGLPVPAIDINLGFGTKSFDGELSMTSPLTSESADLSFVLPVLYAGMRFEIPGIPVGLEADIKYIGYDESKFSDTRIKADWAFIDSGIAVAAELGYRQQALVIKDLSGADAEADITIDGLFAGLSARF